MRGSDDSHDGAAGAGAADPTSSAAMATNASTTAPPARNRLRCRQQRPAVIDNCSVHDLSNDPGPGASGPRRSCAMPFRVRSGPNRVVGSTFRRFSGQCPTPLPSHMLTLAFYPISMESRIVLRSARSCGEASGKYDAEITSRVPSTSRICRMRCSFGPSAQSPKKPACVVPPPQRDVFAILVLSSRGR